MLDTRVQITGMGAITPHGVGVNSFWDGLIEGRSGFKEIELFDASSFRNSLAGEVSGYPSDVGKLPRGHRMLLDACGEALAGGVGCSGHPTLEETSAAIAKSSGFERMAIVVGTNFGGMSAVERALFADENTPAESSLNDYLFSSAGDLVAETFGLTGPRMHLSLSCASGAAAIGIGLDLIRQDRADAVLACGYDELSLFVFAGLSALRAITPDTIRPFDKRRKGTLFSEGAGAVLLEREDRLVSRNSVTGTSVVPCAEVKGRFMNNDGYHMTAPEQEATGIKKLMREALRDAGCKPEEVDHVNLHATGTPYNDKIETKALHDVFGERGKVIPVCAVKSSIGHTMGAAGVLETIAACKTLQEGLVPPVLGLEVAEQDPECELNVPTEAPLKADIKTILKTSYGFGGTNAAVVIGKV